MYLFKRNKTSNFLESFSKMNGIRLDRDSNNVSTNFGGEIQKFKMVDKSRLEDPEIAKMSLEKNRLASFKNWPFQDEGQTNICTAEKVILKNCMVNAAH